MRGRRVGLLPAERFGFIGRLQERGGGIFWRIGDTGEERLLAAPLPAQRVAEIFDSCPLPVEPESVLANIHGDEHLGVTVVTITAPDLGAVGRLDEVATWAAGACFVEESLDAANTDAARPKRRGA